jgi:hypothetical protein
MFTAEEAQVVKTIVAFSVQVMILIEAAAARISYYPYHTAGLADENPGALVDEALCNSATPRGRRSDVRDAAMAAMHMVILGRA